MKTEKKLEYLSMFPAVPNNLSKKMEETKACGNYCVFIAKYNVLFVRCFHIYYDTKRPKVETQRYVFAPDGYCRYGCGMHYTEYWRPLSKFTEPVFVHKSYGYADNRYVIYNKNEYKKTFLKYCQLDKYGGEYTMMYLRLLLKYPNAEYLVKSSYGHIVTSIADPTCYRYPEINWKSNNLLKMLDLTKSEFKALAGNEKLYSEYIRYRTAFSGISVEVFLKYREIFGSWIDAREIETLQTLTGLTANQICNYLTSQNAQFCDWRDYLNRCEEFNYNLLDSAVSRPKNLQAAHDRVTLIKRQVHDAEEAKQFAENMKWREHLCFETADYIIRQPISINEIVAEGAALSHCVGGYAGRHAAGKLHIMFLRKKSDANTPYYTIEVSITGKIIQCRGYKNNWTEHGGTAKPQEIIDLEAQYQNFLDTVFSEKIERKSA